MKYLKTKEAAEYLRVHPNTILRLSQRGELPSVRIGRSLTFDVDDLDALADRSKEQRKIV